MTRIKGWVTRGNLYFEHSWRLIPFQPLLFLFAFLGALLIIVDGNIAHPQIAESLPFSLWISLSLLCPPMAGVAWWLIKHRPGRPRYVALWLRLGADLGQLASISAFLVLIGADIDLVPAEVYAAQLFSAVWWFLLLLVVRDSWKLVLTERIASAIDVSRRHR